MASLNLFKLIFWVFRSLARLVIFLYKWARLHIRKLTSHLGPRDEAQANKVSKSGSDGEGEEEEEEDDDDDYSMCSSSSSGDEGCETCRQRKVAKNGEEKAREEPQNADKMTKSAIGRTLRMKKELVLDLDETLVHSTTEWAVSYHFTVTVKLPCGVLSGESDVLQTSARSQAGQGASGDDMYPAVFYVTKRPHLDAFLKKVSKWYNLSVFTSSLRAYAEPVIEQIDTHHLIKRKFYRDVNEQKKEMHCFYVIFHAFL